MIASLTAERRLTDRQGISATIGGRHVFLHRTADWGKRPQSSRLGPFSLAGLRCVLLSPLPLQSAPLLWWAVLAFLGVRVPNPRPWLNSTVGHIPTHMIRCLNRTHMKEDTGTRTTPDRHQTPMHKTRAFAQATLMAGHRTHIAELRTLSAFASSSQRQTAERQYRSRSSPGAKRAAPVAAPAAPPATAPTGPAMRAPPTTPAAPPTAAPPAVL